MRVWEVAPVLTIREATALLQLLRENRTAVITVQDTRDRARTKLVAALRDRGVVREDG